MEITETKKLENLQAALAYQLSRFDDARKKNNYMLMSECAADIQKLSFAIGYLSNNMLK